MFKLNLIKIKCIFPILVFILINDLMVAQEPVQSRLPDDQIREAHLVNSGLYTLSDPGADQLMMSGSTAHFSKMTFRFETLQKQDGERQLAIDEEQILIIKEGEATVTHGQNSKTIGPNSVFFLLPDETGSISAQSPKVTFYQMVYTAIPMEVSANVKKKVSSFIIDYDTLYFREHSKGGVRKYFNRSTAMLPYYEMHATTLDPGIQSHPPHTHEAAEIILIIDGETEEEIDGRTYRGQPGDLYFLASDIPHAIRNVGDKPCQYFAFQWGERTDE